MENDWEQINRPVECVHLGAHELRSGDRVRLRPRRRADILDLALNGRLARVAAIEQDFESRIHLAVVLDDDPGADLGVAWFPAHRFFFDLDEVEPLGDETPDSFTELDTHHES